MSDYPLLQGSCTLPDQGITEALRAQILAAFQLLGDDPPSPSRSVDIAADSEFIREGSVVKLRDHNGRKTPIRWISELPFRDVVLQPSGNKDLTNEAIVYIKKFTSFVKRTNIVFENGRFQCPRVIARTTGTSCTMKADRPCPLYYSATQPGLRATTVEPLGIPGRSNGRVLVHLDAAGVPVPDVYKQEIIYAGTGQAGCVIDSRISFRAVEYPQGGAVYQLCGRAWLTSESAVNTIRIQVAVCGDDGHPRLDIYAGSGLSDSVICCDCGECPVYRFQDRQLINAASGEVTGRLTGVRMLSQDEERLWKECEGKVREMNRLSDKFASSMSLATLAGMLRVSESQAAVVVSLAADGCNPWAARACYTGLAGPGQEGNASLMTTASSLSLCTWETHEGTYNLATCRLLYVEWREGSVAHVVGGLQLSNAEIFRPSKYPSLQVGGQRRLSIAEGV